MKKYTIILSLLFCTFTSFSQLTNSCTVPNAGFELGNTSGWTFKSGVYGVFPPCPKGTCPRYGTTYTGGIIPGPLNGPLTGTERHTLMSVAGGNDPNAAAGTPVPVVAPGGGNYSFRLGNNVIGGLGTNRSEAEAARLTFLVTNQNAFFTYRYAFFVNDGKHQFYEQPSFEVVVLDKNDSVIPCGRYFVVPGNFPNCINATGFLTGRNGFIYKPWTDVGLDLTGYIGQNISIEFRTTDCIQLNGGNNLFCAAGTCTLSNALGTCTYVAGTTPCTPVPSGTATSCPANPGTHSAYAYIDAYCSPINPIIPVFCAGASSIQICAPVGYQSYSWPAGQLGIVGSPTTQCVNITNPVAGTVYTVNLTSVTGCLTKTTIKLSGLDVTLRDTTICAGAPAFPLTLTPSTAGTYNYTWTPSAGLSCTNCQSPIFTPGSSNASYTVTIKDPAPGGCTVTKVVNITVNQNLSVTATGTNVCSGTSAVLTATGQSCQNAITYSWSPGTFLSSTTGPTVTAVNPTSTTVYTVTITDGTGNTTTTTAVLNVNPTPITTVNSATVCPNTPVVLTASSSATGANYSWSNGSTINPITVTPNSTTSYTVTGTTLSCTSSAVATVVISNVLVPTVNSPTICAGGSATLTLNGGTTFTWSTGSNSNPIVISPLLTTPYTATVTNAFGCTGTVTAIVIVDPLTGLSITNPTAVCSPLTIDITAAAITAGSTGGGVLSYWLDAAATQTLTNPTAIATAGTYYIKITTPGGCTDIKPVVVTFNSSPISDAGPNLILCSGTTGVIGAAAVTGYNYDWSLPNGLTSSTVSNPTVNLTNTGALPIVTIYTVTTTEIATGCKTNDTVMVIISPATIANAGVSQSACVGSTFTLAGSVGGSATSGIWSGGSGLFSPSNSALNANYVPTTAEYSAGSVTLTLTSNDPVGPCTFASSSMVLNFQPNPVVNFSVDIPKGCPIHCVKFKDLTTINAPDAIKNWSWSFGDGGKSTLQNPPHCYNLTGLYTVSLTATSNLGCSSSLVIPSMIEVYPVPIASFIPSPTITTIYEPLIQFQNTSQGASTYNWTFGDPFCSTLLNSSTLVNPNHTYSVTGTYTIVLVATSIHGCVDKTQRIIEVQPDWTFYIPNAFTPNNGDGVNDFFTGFGVGIEAFEMWIFDRWGVNIFYTNDMTKGWDGRIEGHSEQVQQDVYIWKVKIKDIFLKEHHYVGHVNLLK